MMFCQVCGAKNQESDEYCRQCHQKLLVVSGALAIESQEEFDASPEEHFSFDEHLLERISILEEVVRRTTESVRQTLGVLYKLEQKILVNQTGITSLRDLLEDKRILAREEWSELWESRMDYQLLALEKRERFLGVVDKIAELYGGEDAEPFRRLLHDAGRALQGLDIEAALRLLGQAHDLDPLNYELSFFLGETFFNDGDAETAWFYFRLVLEAKPDHYESLILAGVLLNELGQEKRAEDHLKRAVQLYPESFLPAFSLGAVYAADGRLAPAKGLLRKAVELDPVPQALYLLGRCHYESGELGLAIEFLQNTVSADPIREEAHYLLGLAYLDRRWYRKAQESLGEAHRLAPARLSFRELHQVLEQAAENDAVRELDGAEDLLHRGEQRAFLSAYRRALAQEPENPALMVSYAIACLELGRTQEIEPLVRKILGGDHSATLRAAASATHIEALRSQGRFREGDRLGRALLSEGGSDVVETVACFEIAMNLAEIEEDLDEALRYARRSLETAPDALTQISLSTLGWVHYKRREWHDAVDCLDRSSTALPTSRTLTHLGMALLAAGERDRAREVLHEAHSLNDEDPGWGEKILECLKDGTRRPTHPAARP